MASKRDPDYSSTPVEYAVDPDKSLPLRRILFNWEEPSTFVESLFRVELSPGRDDVNFIDRYFRISQRGSTIWTEVIGRFTLLSLFSLLKVAFKINCLH